MGKWRTSGTQLRGRCAESRHAAASLRVPGYVRVSSLRDEMRLSGCLYNRSSAVDVRVLVSRGRRANPVLTYETALRRFFEWQSALFMGKWRASGTQLRGRCAESRHAAASLRVPGYVRVSSLRDEMCLSGCLYNRSSAVSLGVTCEAFA